MSGSVTPMNEDQKEELYEPQDQVCVGHPGDGAPAIMTWEVASVATGIQGASPGTQSDIKVSSQIHKIPFDKQPGVESFHAFPWKCWQDTLARRGRMATTRKIIDRIVSGFQEAISIMRSAFKIVRKKPRSIAFKAFKMTAQRDTDGNHCGE